MCCPWLWTLEGLGSEQLRGGNCTQRSRRWSRRPMQRCSRRCLRGSWRGRPARAAHERGLGRQPRMLQNVHRTAGILAALMMRSVAPDIVLRILYLCTHVPFMDLCTLVCTCAFHGGRKNGPYTIS
jgi:hypothetical protein